MNGEKKNNMKTLFIIDKYNAAVGAAIAVLTAVFGTYWYIFAAYLLLNVCDWLTGWWKSRQKHEESSKVGLKGAIKKLGYWIIILVAFVIADVFVAVGHDLLGIDLAFLTMIGWFTLAMLLVNEARSILENLVEMGYKVPDFLIKGLAITEKMMKKKLNIDTEEKDDEKNTNATE